jgi:crossover junction endodeoxyribonuclease RuvC
MKGREIQPLVPAGDYPIGEQAFDRREARLRVLGIDPGVATMGFAVIERAGSKLAPVTFGAIRTPAAEAQARRLVRLREALVTIISEHRPDVAAVERLFFTTNAKTAMAVGQASGIALGAAGEAGIEVADYTPNEVKQSVCGYGSASKAQIQAMVAALLGLSEPPRPPDAADACALAICHLNRAGLVSAIKRKLA